MQTIEIEQTTKRYLSTLRYLEHIKKTGKINLLTRSQRNALRSRLSRYMSSIKRYLKLATLSAGLCAASIVDVDAQCQMKRLPISTQTSFSTFNSYVAPTFADIDKDGDLDLMVGHRKGMLITYENNNGYFERLNGLVNPFSAGDTLYFLAPAFADLDLDGDFDAFIGSSSGIAYFKNGNGTFTEVVGDGNPLDGISGQYFSPAFADIDLDGDLDVFIGEYNGSILFYRNENGTFTNVTGADNPFNGQNFGTYSKPSPTFVDIDGDGDSDAFVAPNFGTIRFFENDAGALNEVTGTGNPLNGVDVGVYAKPTFVDIDNDGDPDAYIGDLHGFIRFFKNENDVFTEEIVSDNSFEAVDLGSSSAPTFGEIDNDGDEELVIGDQDGTLRYFINNNDTFNEAVGDNNPFDNIDVGSRSKPVLIDLDPTDSDFELDLFVGASDGTIHFYKNTGGSFEEVIGTGNPFDGVDFGTRAAPAFVDFNKDNAPDAFIGTGDGTIHYYKNNNDGTFSRVLLFGNPFTAVDVGQSATVAFNLGNKSRAIIGSSDGRIREYKLGPTNYYQLVDDSPFEGVGVGFSSVPAIQNNGKVFIGQSQGKIFVFNKEGSRSNLWEGSKLSHWNRVAGEWELMKTPRGGCDNVYVMGKTILKVDPTHLAAGRTLTVKEEGQFEVKSGAQLIIAKDVIIDNSGNIYRTGKIGKNTWMLENLRTTAFNDGTFINQIDAGDTWSSFEFPARTPYNNIESNLIPYGYLYNGYAVEDNRMCPAGWHVSTLQDWEALIIFLGGPAIAAGPLKEAGFEHWTSPNTGATDEVGFGALPGGNRRPDGSFANLTLYGNYWVIDQPGPTLIDYNIEYNTADITQIPTTDKKWGLSVRCVEN